MNTYIHIEKNKPLKPISSLKQFPEHPFDQSLCPEQVFSFSNVIYKEPLLLLKEQTEKKIFTRSWCINKGISKKFFNQLIYLF